ncbi:MAG: DUF1858 domain-containing protein [Eubacteriales bacterium]|nr:DUF1858 domain-containing protein [Eubacteriales bacterium]
MEINKDTMLKDLLNEYPWLKDELINISDKFKLLNTPLGKIMLNKVNIEDISKRSGIDIDTIIAKANELIKNHQ